MRLFNLMMMNILLLGGLSFSTCNQAKAAELPQDLKLKALQQEIKSKVIFPDELSDKEVYDKVLVDFRIKKGNVLEVVEVKCANEFLKSYVKKQMESIVLSETDLSEETVFQISILFEN